jgi:hypothetical protein
MDGFQNMPDDPDRWEHFPLKNSFEGIFCWINSLSQFSLFSRVVQITNLLKEVRAMNNLMMRAKDREIRMAKMKRNKYVREMFWELRKKSVCLVSTPRVNDFNTFPNETGWIRKLKRWKPRWRRTRIQPWQKYWNEREY